MLRSDTERLPQRSSVCRLLGDSCPRRRAEPMRRCLFAPSPGAVGRDVHDMKRIQRQLKFSCIL